METFSDKLINWHKISGRKDLPWQIDKSPYKVWISEIMLQQTQVTTVIPYFERFLIRFPNISSLAEANQNDVLSLWSGLGYYARARNLHKTAIILNNDFGSLIPDSFDELINLPGIGRSTAGAILSLGFNKRAPILDGNVKRVMARYMNIKEDIGMPRTIKRLWSISEELLPKEDFATYNQSLMDLGATICRRKKPLCEECPVSKKCLSRMNNSMNIVPFKSQRGKKSIKKVFWLLPYTDTGYIYLKRRPNEGIWGGLWAFFENKDLNKLIKEPQLLNFDSNKNSLHKFSTITHSFSHYNLEADLYIMEFKSSNINKKWININELDSFGLPSPVIEALTEIKDNGKISFL